MQAKALNEFSAKNESDGCLLCYTASCTTSCPHGLDPAKVIRSLRFENIRGAEELVGESVVCQDCAEKSCTKACIKSKVDRPVRIPELMQYVRSCRKEKGLLKAARVDLGIKFCGVPCENPFFLSSSVVASNYEMVARAFQLGWAGAAFKTIGTFVPQEVSPRFATIRKEGTSFIGFKNIEQISDHTLEENLTYLHRLKQEFPHKVLIASILGQNEDEWTFLARRVTEAGVDIIECNFSCPHMTGEGLGSDVGQNPELVALYTEATRKGTHLPILAKMTPNIGNMEIPAMAAMKNGATGIAAINTIKSIMNIHLDDFSSEPQVDGKSCVGGYSGKTVKPIALRFIHDLKKHPDLKDVPISGMGGIETWRDAAEFLTLGCTNLQVTTSVMQYGYRLIDDLKDGLSSYLGEKGFSSVREMVGAALPNLVPADRLNRHSISYPKFERKQCLGCGRCYLSCLDGGHQALVMDEAAGKPILAPQKCVGCQLCMVVCPVGAISSGKRVEV
ncbi:NAD-dependent dihydropyrimidine dehydrogenase subunit PreA [Desulfosporosinus sp. PR]|uniref:NAD-dependent dihydropyrimidine dehydrogenase subunit PreA n=1 Tax=Candidatus Desulfosporosinus nitrosoreducens TaxID=3401928 RepID=UPI0027EFADF5|nr:NAD-dependent dihydropyrimidine dehydrogenase subunit PreA [Desulfosporosinus sp. PR]MDQ7097149.1 NAD-dependent dihydropyrimidine dehydrogenase subunit PreA [Desulfosporosinus sp. PR]